MVSGDNFNRTRAMPFTLVPFLLLAIPLAEIAAFVIIGGQIGVLATLGLVVATAVAGSILLRAQGFGLLTRIRNEVDAGRVPARDLVHGVMIMVAGVLLLTPGFVTDSAGLLLFIPGVRDAIWAFLKSRIVVVGAGGTDPRTRPDQGRQDGRTIDLDSDDYRTDPESPWNKPG